MELLFKSLLFIISENDVVFYPTSRGQLSAVYQGHTFTQTKSKIRWYCSKKKRDGCKAILLLTEAKKFVALLNDHDHPLPITFTTKSGKIIRFYSPKVKNTVV